MKAATLARTGVQQTAAGFATNPNAAVGPQFSGLRAVPLPKKAARGSSTPQNRASVISASEKAPEKKPRDVTAKAVATAPPPPAQGESAPPKIDAERLVPRVAKNEEGFWELKKEFQASLNPAEKVGVFFSAVKMPFCVMRFDPAGPVVNCQWGLELELCGSTWYVSCYSLYATIKSG